MVLFLPRSGRVRLKSSLAGAFVVIGEAILLSGVEGEILITAQQFLAAGLLLLAEIATSRDNPRLSVGCALAALALGVLAVRGHRRSAPDRYGRHGVPGS
ncbi:hypothetical protein IM697_21450 [Streptomyces ferrugineus]|uniref:Uncharacterized protein n=1 Tax=Streptomyces ferrugineus TaxID=1413221 RepID=A0A7M2SX26_9ACTN|nr:hypothetical protein [Streptomyces ferrugineus]QOV40734.1 hypothetical protein IM697_21450 [Streptomyces ferrugineus]